MDGLEIMQEKERANMVKKGLEMLNPAESVVLTLFYLEDQSIKEISAITGSTESNVKVQLFRGRKHLAIVLIGLTKNELIGLS
jgi:RNA polymerase sigma factor (sigma-70 family)